MGALLVLAAEQDGESLAEGLRLLTLARAAGHDARPAGWSERGWRVGDSQATFADLAAVTPTDAPAASAAASAAPSAAPGSAPSAAPAALLLARPAERRLPVDLMRAVAAAPWPRTGCAPVAAALADDRLLAKLAASQWGARCAGHEEVGETHRPYWTIQQRLGLPCAVKPAQRGLGALSFVPTEAQLRPAVAAATQADPTGRCLIEEWCPGTPVAVTVCCDDAGAPRVLPLVGLVPPVQSQTDLAGEARHDAQAALPAAAVSELRQLALGLSAQLDLGALCLLEAVVPRDGGRPVFLGLESRPSLAPAAPAALAAAAAGLDESALLAAALRSERQASP